MNGNGDARLVRRERPRLSPGLRAAAAVLALIALKCGVSAWALHTGFTHVSDDDYARVTIAQAFAHAPHLDPTGTSWLPFPFWLNGAVMAVAGRTLAVARAVAIVSAVLGALLVHRALLVAGVRALAAWCGVAIAMCTPWNAWLGVATVPEALTASLIATGAISLATDDPTSRLAGSAALLCACLSRYEAWPVAAVFACASTICAVSGSVSPPARRRFAVGVLVALAGPACWLLWNAHAHGNALHFLARVAAYRARMTGASARATLTLYPEAFVRAGPLTLALTAVGSPGLLVDRELRRRWAWPLAATAALVLFLVEGALHDGAPTHHPERALVAVFWIGSTFGIDGVRSLATRFVWAHPRREAAMVGLIVALAVAWGLVWPSRIADYPAHSGGEDRAPQMARGADLRLHGVSHLTVTPCAYEHFALIAAFEAPERVTVLAPGEVRAVTAACPLVEAP